MEQALGYICYKGVRTMNSFILGGEEIEYWDAYDEQRERQ